MESYNISVQYVRVSSTHAFTIGVTGSGWSVLWRPVCAAVRVAGPGSEAESDVNGS